MSYQVLAFKKSDILWHLTKVGRCLHVHEIHVSFFLSILLSVKFKYDHKRQVSGMAHKLLGIKSDGFVVFPFKRHIC